MLAPLAEISGEAQTPQSATETGPIARWEVPVTIVGIATASTWSGLAHIENCRWCERTPDGADTVNQLDRAARGAMRWSDTNLGSANALSNVTIYAPVGFALLHRDLDKRGILTVVESLTATALIGQTIKVATARERPSFHYQSPANLDETKDRYTSFISGHSAQAFAAVASTARATAARHRPTKWLWLSGLSARGGDGLLQDRRRSALPDRHAGRRGRRSGRGLRRPGAQCTSLSEAPDDHVVDRRTWRSGDRVLDLVAAAMRRGYRDADRSSTLTSWPVKIQ